MIEGLLLIAVSALTLRLLFWFLSALGQVIEDLEEWLK